MFPAGDIVQQYFKFWPTNKLNYEWLNRNMNHCLSDSCSKEAFAIHFTLQGSLDLPHVTHLSQGLKNALLWSLKFIILSLIKEELCLCLSNSHIHSNHKVLTKALQLTTEVHTLSKFQVPQFQSKYKQKFLKYFCYIIKNSCYKF